VYNFIWLLAEKLFITGGKDMTEFKTRSEKHAEAIERFLESDSKEIVLLLYGSEVKKLEKKFPILITRKNKHGELHKCCVYKK